VGLCNKYGAPEPVLTTADLQACACACVSLYVCVSRVHVCLLYVCVSVCAYGAPVCVCVSVCACVYVCMCIWYCRWAGADNRWSTIYWCPIPSTDVIVTLLSRSTILIFLLLSLSLFGMCVCALCVCVCVCVREWECLCPVCLCLCLSPLES